MKFTYKKIIMPIIVLFIGFNLLLSKIPMDKFSVTVQLLWTLLINPIAIVNIVLFLLFYWLWKFPLVNLIFKTPNLQGTWGGKIKYTYEGKNLEKIVFLTISQPNVFSVKCRFFTDERISISDLSNIEISDIYQKLIYTYHSEENINNKEKNPMHTGTVELNISGEKKKKHLDGFYYTNRKSNGTMELTFLSKKKINSYVEGYALSDNKI